MHRQFLRIALVSFLATCAWAQQDVVTVKSPDGRIEFRLLDGPPPTPDTQLPHLAYQVDYDGKPLIKTSYLGFEIYNQIPLGQKLGLVKTYPDAVDEKYYLQTGKAFEVRNHFNEIVAEYLQNGSQGRLMTVEVRAFNDGLAFRYVVQPSPPLLQLRIENEITEFNFAKDGDSFPQILPNFQSGYAEPYTKRTLSTVPYDSLVGLPFLVQQPGVAWVAVTEADVDEYPALYLTRTDRTKMHARLSPRVDGSSLSVFTKPPLVTPWRVLLIGDRPEKLIESNIVTSLNLQTKLPQPSGNQPGRMMLATPTTEAAKQAIDAGFEYTLIGEGWSAAGNGGAGDLLKPNTDFDLPGVLAYANQKKVGVWLWTDWRAIESQMDEAFVQFEKWGVRGVKLDHWNRDDQEAVVLLHKIVAKAEQHKLMLAIGGGYKPDGLQRLYPNLMTTEAAITSAYSQFSAAANPDHEVMLAFTRLLAGPLDYGFGGLNNATRESFQPGMTLGTRAHQLALSVVFHSPVQTVRDLPATEDDQRDFNFLRRIPQSFGETRAIAGEVGEYMVIARRNGSPQWYLGAITNWEAREIDVNLDFLGPGNYIANMFVDAPDAATNPKHDLIEQRPVTASQTLHLKLASGGGAAIQFVPALTIPQPAN